MPKLLFIAGLHRSGTSLIHKAIAEHPEVSGFSGTGVYEDEGQHLQTVYPKASLYGGPGKFGFHPDSSLDETSSLVGPDQAEKLFGEWSKYWDQTKSLLVEKSPPNLTKTRFLQALFPEAYFLIILRHPVAVSYATQKWSHTSLYSLFRHWAICHDRFQFDRPFLKRCLIVKYEDFVIDLNQSLTKIFNFLELETFQTSFEASDAHNHKYYERWKAFGRNPLWHWYRQFLIYRFEGDLQRFDYSFSDII